MGIVLFLALICQAFQDCLEKLKKQLHWMYLAGGTEPCLPVVFRCAKESSAKIILEKKGYDLPTENLNRYYSGTVWTERERALERFAADLFCDRAEELTALTNMEFIADQLIKLESPERPASDYTLRVEEVVTILPEWKGYGDVRALYKKHLF